INPAVHIMATKSFDFAKCHYFNAPRHKRFFHWLDLEWLDDGLDFLHRAKLETDLSNGKHCVVAASCFEQSVALSVRHGGASTFRACALECGGVPPLFMAAL